MLGVQCQGCEGRENVLELWAGSSLAGGWRDGSIAVDALDAADAGDGGLARRVVWLVGEKGVRDVGAGRGDSVRAVRRSLLERGVEGKEVGGEGNVVP